MAILMKTSLVYLVNIFETTPTYIHYITLKIKTWYVHFVTISTKTLKLRPLSYNAIIKRNKQK